MITALIGSALSNKDKGGQIVRQEKPAMQPFVTQVETVKRESTAKPSAALLPSVSSVDDAGTKARPKGVRPKAKLIGRKLATLRNIFRSRLNFVRRDAQIKTREDEKEKRGKRENLLEKINLGGIKSAVAPITRPFTSFFDEVLNAVGLIVVGLVGKLAIDNPEAFTGAIKGLEAALETIANIFIGTIDLFSSIIDRVDQIEKKFEGFIDGTFGDGAFKSLTDLGGNLTQLLDASVLLAGLLLQYTLQELAQPDTDRGGKPGKPGKPVPGTRPGSSLTPKERLSLQKYLDRNPSTRLIQRQYGATAANIYQNALDNGKNPRAANAAVQRAINRGQIKPSPQAGSLRGGIAGSNILKGNLGKSANRLGLKLFGKAGLATAKGVFGRIPVLGPILVAVASIMAGEPMGQTLFKTAGAAIGGLLGSFIPIPILGTMLGEFIGTFVGDLFYELTLGGGPKKAGQKLQQAISNALATGGKVLDWLKAGFGRFYKGIPKVSFPDKLGIIDLKNFPLKIVRDIAGKKFPNPGWLINPMNIVDKLKLLKNSFFPPGAKPSTTSNALDYQQNVYQFSTAAESGGESSADKASVSAGSVGSGEMDLFERLVLAEAAGEGVTGMALVARSVLNRAGLIQSGKASTGTFLAKDKTVTGVIMGTNQYQPVSSGSINKNWGEGSRKLAKQSIQLAQDIDQLRSRLKAEGVSDGKINILLSSTGFRNYNAGAGQDASQKVNEVNYKRHTFNTAGNPGLKISKANISSSTSTPSDMFKEGTPKVTPQPPSTQIASSAQLASTKPSTPVAAATPTISQPAPYDEKGKMNPLLMPLPAPPVRNNMPTLSGPSGGQGVSNSWVLNYYYIQQISAFLYKQG